MRSNTKAPSAPVILTHEGTVAARLSPLQSLRRTLLSCLLFEHTFYEDGEAVADRLARLTRAVQPQDAAALAIEARTAFKLRHAPLYMARVLAGGTPEQRAVVGDLLTAIIQRPDEMTEFLAMYWEGARKLAGDVGSTKLSSQVRKGLAAAFGKFDAYALAKYDRDDAVKLRDVMRLVHPKPTSAEQAALWQQVLTRTLPTPDTWEVALSSGADKRATWERLLSERKLGALALLRNLRNMQQAGVPIEAIREGLRTMKVERVLPFRFIAAAAHAPLLEGDLEAAMFRCLAGAPKLPGVTALVVDTSPSMWQAQVSSKSDMTRFDAAAALAILCREIGEDVRVFAFNERAHDVPNRRGFALRDALAKTQGGYSRGTLAVDRAQAMGYDRIIVLTDGEWHGPEHDLWVKNAKDVLPDPLEGTGAYLINVSVHDKAIGSKRWTMIDGWSESVVAYVQAMELERSGQQQRASDLVDAADLD